MLELQQLIVSFVIKNVTFAFLKRHENNKDMKRYFALLFLLCMSAGWISAQNPTPYIGTPPTFNTFNANYVKCRYGQSSSSWSACHTSNEIWKYNTSGSNYSWYQTTITSTINNATTGTMQNGTNFSHRLITGQNANPGGGVVNGRDACMCYQVGNTYIQDYVMPVGGLTPWYRSAAPTIRAPRANR